MKSIDNTICISTMIAVSGFVPRIYRRILCKSETKPRADMFTLRSPRKKVKERHFPRFHARWRVGHVLVLVFAATRRHLGLSSVPAAMLNSLKYDL